MHPTSGTRAPPFRSRATHRESKHSVWDENVRKCTIPNWPHFGPHRSRRRQGYYYAKNFESRSKSHSRLTRTRSLCTRPGSRQSSRKKSLRFLTCKALKAGARHSTKKSDLQPNNARLPLPAIPSERSNALPPPVRAYTAPAHQRISFSVTRKARPRVSERRARARQV